MSLGMKPTHTQLKPTIVIAEIGVNHNGDSSCARELVIAARDAGANYAKFQTFSAESLTTANAPTAAYQKNFEASSSQRDMLKDLELSFDDFRQLKSFCESSGIGFLTTAHDFAGAEFVLGLELDYIKVPSGDLTNLPFLERVAREKSRVILSTGMATFEEVAQALEVFENQGLGRELVTVLQCTTDYPAPLEDTNLRAMVAMADELMVEVGFSDHTDSIEASIAAVALGARIIEKHLTLDRSMAGPDHSASVEPNVFSAMVQSLRAVERAMGSAVKSPGPTEAPNREIVRKSIVAVQHIRKGEIFTTENLGVKRPGSGISPMRWHEVIGKVAHRDFRDDELVALA